MKCANNQNIDYEVKRQIFFNPEIDLYSEKSVGGTWRLGLLSLIFAFVWMGAGSHLVLGSFGKLCSLQKTPSRQRTPVFSRFSRFVFFVFLSKNRCIDVSITEWLATSDGGTFLAGWTACCSLLCFASDATATLGEGQSTDQGSGLATENACFF